MTGTAGVEFWWDLALLAVLGVWQLWAMLRLRKVTAELDRVHGLYRALAKDVAELRSDVGDLIPHPPVLGTVPPYPGPRNENYPSQLSPSPEEFAAASDYDSELSRALNQMQGAASPLSTHNS